MSSWYALMIIVDINSVSYSNLYKVQGQVVSQDVLDDITEGGISWRGSRLPNGSLKFVPAKLSRSGDSRWVLV